MASSNVGPDISFNNVVISNDYPVLTGGTWRAYLDTATGKTMYQQGTTGPSYEGPVNIVGGNLVVENGAVADGIVVVGGAGSANPSITIQNGGTLQNSQAFNGSVTIQGGGVSQYNQYVAERFSIGGTTASPGTSLHDTFYRPGPTNANAGQLIVNGNVTKFNVSGYGGAITTGGIVNIESPSWPDITANNPGTSSTGAINVVVGVSSTLGAPYHSEFPNYSNYNISNNYPVLTGGTWRAYLDPSTGKTMYQQGTTGPTYEGPVNLIDITSLTIESGAVVDNLWQFGTTNATITIQNGGTLQNSHIFNGYTDVQSGGISTNNDYVSQVVYVRNGGTSSGDYFYEGSNGVGGHFTSTNPNSSNYRKDFYTGDGGANIYVYGGATYEDFHIKTGPSSNITLYMEQGADVKNDPACFLAGVLIDTFDGYRKVEDIQVGDVIKTYDWQNQFFTYSNVVWVGKDNKVIDQSLPDDLAGYPVRVLKNAIAENTPSEDLLLTSEHCLFFEDKFIPVRMLVNGGSIFYDHSFSSYDYYHIKTENHSVICANNVLTESFLYTESHKDFVHNQNIVFIDAGIQTWENDAVAPLVVNQGIVEPIFENIKARALHNNIECQLQKDYLSDEIVIHLITDQNQILTKVKGNNDQFIFVIPPHVSSVRILSQTSRPSDVIGPFMNDRRYLGVLIGDIVLFDDDHIEYINSHLEDHKLLGWHTIESSLYRWTKGNAFLSLTPADKTRILSIKIIAGGPYIQSTANIDIQKAS